MIRYFAGIAAATALFMLGTLAATPATAGGYHSKHHHGYYDGHPGYHYPRIPFVYELGRVVGAFLPHGRYYHHSGHNYHRQGHRHHRYHRHHRDRYYPPRRHYSHTPTYRPHRSYHRGNGCHPVTKTAYHHGRLAKIGGTMCYDAYGNPYVVSGSRYVMHYLY